MWPKVCGQPLKQFSWFGLDATMIFHAIMYFRLFVPFLFPALLWLNVRSSAFSSLTHTDLQNQFHVHYITCIPVSREAHSGVTTAVTMTSASHKHPSTARVPGGKHNQFNPSIFSGTMETKWFNREARATRAPLHFHH